MPKQLRISLTSLSAGEGVGSWQWSPFRERHRMTSLVHHITIHCADPYRLAQFWAEVLDGSLAEDVLPGDPKPW
ncbi:hypothetical protein GCM10010303_86290 [Streptomyces purpurascens]|nr:hypothetical protein GCM10010303_86290 [Streptomyces purpurascens]